MTQGKSIFYDQGTGFKARCRTLVRTSLLCILLLLGVGVLPAGAASPWKWQFGLKTSIPDMPVKFPTGMFVDQERERYYVADAETGSLHSYDKNGKYLNSFKPGNNLNQPFSLVRDAQDMLWVVEKGRNTLTKIDLKGKKLEPKSLKADGRDIYPDRILLHDGSFYILDKLSGDIVVFDSSLKSGRVFACSDCSGGFIDFAIKSGQVWGLARSEKAVYRFSDAGVPAGKIKLDGDLAFPYAIEIGAANLLYVLDRHDGSIAVFDQSGVFKYRFLERGHTRGKLYYPEDILFDPWGRLCIVDAGNGRVEVFGR
ncbi:MAG: hypothetical protein KKG47_07955 [Proteobacteria bacterium]|nr:hypothetical protein [Pseudomonadota bacterium]MBU1738232.1 hypothetical protein [Pseudomonadota bacterium]